MTTSTGARTAPETAIRLSSDVTTMVVPAPSSLEIRVRNAFYGQSDSRQRRREIFSAITLRDDHRHVLRLADSTDNPPILEFIREIDGSSHAAT